MVVTRYLGRIALAASFGCSNDVANVGGDETDTGSETGIVTETETGDHSETETGGPEPDLGDLEPYCGDGGLDMDEECDDGNDVDEDGCSNECVSACGAEFAANLVLPGEGEFFAVQAMRPDPDGGVTLLGGVTTSGVGRLRMATIVENQLSVETETGPLGPPGDMDAPQRHDVTHVAMTASGDVFALGRTVDPNADPAESAWLARYSPDLTEIWRVPVGGAGEDFRPRGLAVLENGDPVVTRTVWVADNDHDALFRRMSFEDGSEVWSSTHSGEFNAGWSLDEAWAVAGGPGDALWGTALVRVDYQTHDSTLVELDAEDGSVLSTAVPLSDPGPNHRQRPTDLAVGPGDVVALALNVYGPASKFTYSRVYVHEGGEPSWELNRDDLPWEDGDPHIDPKVAIDEDGTVLVSGTYTHEFGFGSAARVWVAKLDPGGALYCYARIGEGNNGGVVPRNGFFGTGRAAVNLDTFGPGGMGPGSQGNWLIGLRQ